MYPTKPFFCLLAFLALLIISASGQSVSSSSSVSASASSSVSASVSDSVSGSVSSSSSEEEGTSPTTSTSSAQPTAPTAPTTPPVPTPAPVPAPTPAPVTPAPTFSALACSTTTTLQTGLNENLLDGIGINTMEIIALLEGPLPGQIVSAVQDIDNPNEIFLLFRAGGSTGAISILSVDLSDVLNVINGDSTDPVETDLELSVASEPLVDGINAIITNCEGDIFGYNQEVGVLYLLEDGEPIRAVARFNGIDLESFAMRQRLFPIAYNSDTGTDIFVVQNDPDAMTSTLIRYPLACNSDPISSTLITPSGECGDGDVTSVTYLGGGMFTIGCISGGPAGSAAATPVLATLDIVTAGSATVTNVQAGNSGVGQAGIGGLIPLTPDGSEGCVVASGNDNCEEADDLPTCPDIVPPLPTA